MEEILNREQPNIKSFENKSDANVQSENVVQEDTLTGSLNNKFKSLEELSKAYVNLEKEFTKKCQAYKLLEQKQNSDNASSLNHNREDDLKDKTPQYLQEGWKDKVNEFFTTNPEAKQFIDDISNVLLEDEIISKSENSLEKAFDKVKIKHFRTNEQLMEDDNFIENFVVNNNKVKDKIISSYLSQIVSNKNVPLINNLSGGNVMVSPKRKPKSLKEAGDYMMSLINNK